jgi:hypothetical protein
VALTVSGGQECQGEPSAITYQIVCDPAGNKSVIPSQFVVNGTNQCHPVITFKHKAACPMSQIQSSGWAHDPIEEIRTLFASNYQLYMLQQVVCIILGLYLCFKGERRRKEIIGVALGYSAFIISLAYFWNMTNMGSNSYIPAFLLGAICGYYGYQHLSHLFVAVLGALIGAIFALIIVSILAIDNDLVVYLLIIGGTFIGFTGHFLDNHIEEWMCYISGAYLIVEGLTTFLGGLPSFITGIQSLIHGSNQYTMATVFYIVIFVILIMSGRHYRYK